MAMHPTAPPRQPRGFVILFVVTVLLLITILAITYLRVMRMRMIPVEQNANGADRVIASVLDQALQAIADDMPVRNSAQEDYDYPWTDGTANLMPATLGYPAIRTGLTTSGNPARDDAWLATAYIKDGKWPHLTNLMGSFLDITSSDMSKLAPNATTHVRVPADRLSAGMETDVAINDPRLVDADGDGVPDSFLFYPAVSQVGSLRYVAACYIEDLSAKINLNTATPLRGGGAYGTEALKGLHPGEVDLSALRQLFGATDAELAKIMNYRTGSSAPAPWNQGLRHLAWGDYGSHALLSGDPLTGSASRFGIDSEYELRFHGGLNDRYALNTASVRVPVVAAVESAASGMPGLLRASDVTRMTETNWKTAGFATAESWTLANPRRWVTTLNGECDRQIGLPNAFLSEEVRYNLNIRNDDRYDDALRDWTLSRWFLGPDGLAGSADDYPYPAGFRRFVTTATTRPAEMANVWHASLTDARDKDNLITTSASWCSWEPLPVLTEVYIQRFYATSGSTRSPVRVTCDASGASGVADAQCSYAMEIANPYHFPIKLTNVGFTYHVSGIEWSGQHWLSSCLGSWSDKDADNDPVLLPGHKILLWRNGDTGLYGRTYPNVDISARLSAIAARDSTVHLVASPMVVRPGSSTVNFMQFCLDCKMQASGAKAATGDYYGYSYLTVPWLIHQFSETTARSWAGRPSGTPVGIAQVDVRGFGVGAGLNTLQCRPARQNRMTIDRQTGTITAASPDDAGDQVIVYKKASDGNSPTSSRGYNSRLLSYLGRNNKVPLPAGRIDLSKDKLFHAAIVNSQSEGQFDSLMDVLGVPCLLLKERSQGTNRGNLTNRNQSGSFYTDTDIGHATYELLESGTKPLSSLCVPIEPGTAVYDTNASGATHRRVPWGWLLHCFYDTVNPAMYGGYDYASTGSLRWFTSQENPAKQDANGNRIKDWNGEADFAGYLVPGRININTMPNGLLREALPIKDAVLRGQLADAVEAARASAPATGVRASTDRGLSSPMEILPAAAMLSAFPGVPTADRNGDRVVDYKDAGRFELASSFGCLSNMAACRSDFFAIHILIKGYNYKDFSSGPTASKRVLVIVSRSPMTSAGAKSQIKTWIYNY